jgi:hypothetical protein
MVEGYVHDECLGFVIEYLQRFQVVRSKISDEEEEEGDFKIVIEGGGSKFTLILTFHDMAHQYVLMNNTIMVPWLRSNCKHLLDVFSYKL